MAKRVAVEAGAVVGRYVLLDEIGRGAMGVVHEAFDPRLDRRVAVKILPLPELAAADDDAVLEEARVLARPSDLSLIHI